MREVIQELAGGPAPDLAASQAELQRQAWEAPQVLQRQADSGPQAEEVPETETQARVQQWGLGAVAVGIMAWLIFAPRPNALLVLTAAVVPWLAAMAACWSGGTLHVLARGRRDRRPNVTIAFMLPGIALMMRLTGEFHVLNLQRMVAVACVAGAALAAAGLLADREMRRRPSAWIALLALSGVWGFGAGLGVDAALDGSPATVYRTTVTGQHVSHGRHTSYYVSLAPWGPQKDEDSVEVSWKTYATLRAGDEVCVPLRPGTLGVPWYRVEGCR